MAFQQVVSVPVVDVLVGEVAAEQVDAAVREAGRYGFDLGVEIPIRVQMLRISAREHVVVLLVHHIAGDGASLVPLVRDLASAYGARCSGRAPGL